MFDRHTFSTELAAKLGVHAAIVFHYMAYWVYENAINKRNFKDGKYWTYNSIAALQTHFYYMSAKTITRAIEKLVDAGYIESGCYNQDPYDRTKWYTLTDDAMKIYPINVFLNKGRPLRQNDQNDCPKRKNPLGQNDLADLDKVTKSNTIITNNYNKENSSSNNMSIITTTIKESDEEKENSTSRYAEVAAEFLSSPSMLEAFCKNNRVTFEQCQDIVAEVISEWDFIQPEHQNSTDARKHLLRALQAKIERKRDRGTLGDDASARREQFKTECRNLVVAGYSREDVLRFYNYYMQKSQDGSGRTLFETYKAWNTKTRFKMFLKPK